MSASIVPKPSGRAESPRQVVPCAVPSKAGMKVFTCGQVLLRVGSNDASRQSPAGVLHGLPAREL